MSATLRFFATWGLPFVAYLVVQAAAVLRLRGGARWVALIPLLPMTGRPVPGPAGAGRVFVPGPMTPAPPLV